MKQSKNRQDNVAVDGAFLIRKQNYWTVADVLQKEMPRLRAQEHQDDHALFSY